MVRFIPILFFFLFYPFKGIGQSIFQEQTPSILLDKGQWEYKLFNNLYTQTQGFNGNGSIQDHNRRSSYFKSINQALVGLSSRINVGVEWWLGSVRTGPETESPLEVLRFSRGKNARTALTYAGPRIKYTPFSEIKRLSVESSFLFPIAKDLEGQHDQSPFLADDRYSWILYLYYDQPLGENFQLFSRLAPWMSINREFKQKGSYFSMPLSLFISWFASNRWTVYLQNEVWPTFGTDPLISSWFLQEGLGVKYQLIKGQLELELLYTDFLLGKNSGAGRTFNVGFRILGGN